MGLEKRGLSKGGISLIIILIILVAAILVYNFAIKKDEISEPDPITFQCSSVCESGQKVSFCDVERMFGNGLRATCNELATNSQYSQYGVQACPGISCSTQQEGTQTNDQTCSGLNALWVTPAQNNCPPQEGKLARKKTPSDSPPTAGQICCYYYE